MTRQFNPAEIVFALTAVQEDMFEPDFDLGDEELNQEYRAKIAERLEQGDIWAWASVTVSASWGGFTGTANIGGCNYTDEADFREPGGYFGDMLRDAVADLLKEIKGDGWEVTVVKKDIKAAVANEVSRAV